MPIEMKRREVVGSDTNQYSLSNNIKTSVIG